MECTLCPNNCKIDRTQKIGACNVNDSLRIAKYYLHKYEEPIISGTNGSGTIFFCGCTMKCVFCQNYVVSRNQTGKNITVKELSDIFKKLEDMGAHNINLVTPTQYSDKIIEALRIYKPHIPILYNTSGYEKIEILKKIDPYIDIYLPDLKYFKEKTSLRYTGKKDYFEVASKAITFMAEKPIIIENGLMKSGTIVRHLILPLNVDDSIELVKWFLPLKYKAYFSLMAQYTPFGNIENFPELQRKITKREYDKVLDFLIDNNVSNLFVQSRTSSNQKFIPEWDF